MRVVWILFDISVDYITYNKPLCLMFMEYDFCIYSLPGTFLSPRHQKVPSAYVYPFHRILLWISFLLLKCCPARIRFQFTGLFYSCMWNGAPCKNSTATSRLTDHGLCHTFNGQINNIEIANKTGRNIKTPSYQNQDSYYKDETVIRLSYSLWWKSLYW